MTTVARYPFAWTRSLARTARKTFGAGSPSTQAGFAVARDALFTNRIAVQQIKPNGLAVAQAFGQPTITQQVIPISPNGVAVPITLGQPSVRGMYTPLAQAPLVSGTAQNQKWAHAQRVVLRDNGGAHDWFTLGSPRAASGVLRMLTSQNLGSSWAWVSPEAYAQSIDSDTNAGVQSIAQDSAGNIHLIYWRTGFGDFAYYKMTPTRDGSGHLTGYTSLSTAISVDALAAFPGGDRRAEIQIITTASAAEIIGLMLVGTNAGGFMEAYISITSTLSPSSAADFKNLAGTGTSSTLAYAETTGAGGAHDHTICFAQLGSNKDLHFFGGNLAADAGATAPLQTGRNRLTASGATWTVGTKANNTSTASGGYVLGAFGTANYVWLMIGNYANGQVRFSRVDSSGTWTEPVTAITAPVSDARTGQTMFGVFAVANDESRILCTFTRDPGGGGNWYDFVITSAFWNGNAWTVYNSDTTAHGDSTSLGFGNGLAFGGFDDGTDFDLVALQTRCVDTFDGNIYLTTVRGGALFTSTQTVNPNGIALPITLGSPAIQAGSVNVNPNGVALALGIGQPTVTQTGGVQTVNPNGVAVALALGSPAVQPGSVNVSPNGVALALAFGSPGVSSSATVAPTGLALPLALGTPTLTPGQVTIAPLGVTAALGLGSPAVQAGQAPPIQPNGVALALALGAPTLTPGAATVAPNGVAIPVALGSPTVTQSGVQSINPNGLAIALALGAPAVQAGSVSISPNGVALALSVGQPTITQGSQIAPNGIALPITLGSPAIQAGSVNVSPNGLAIPISFGSPTVTQGQLIQPNGLAISISLGSPAVQPGSVNVSPNGVALALALGAPNVQQAGSQTVNPNGVALPITLGAPAVQAGPKTVSPNGLALAITLGSPGVTQGPITIQPNGLALAIALGHPSVSLSLQYVNPNGVPISIVFGSPSITYISNSSPVSMAIPTVFPSRRTRGVGFRPLLWQGVQRNRGKWQ